MVKFASRMNLLKGSAIRELLALANKPEAHCFFVCVDSFFNQILAADVYSSIGDCFKLAYASKEC